MSSDPYRGLTAADVAAKLGLSPHPEGGYFRETFRDAPAGGGRAHSTAIYYLLGAGDVSAWHRVDAAEVWHWYAGAPLVLTISENGHDAGAHHRASNSPASRWPRPTGGRCRARPRPSDQAA